MTKDQFSNALRILHSLDAPELELNIREWAQFAQAPDCFFVKCDDDTADMIWAAMEKRGNIMDDNHPIYEHPVTRPIKSISIGQNEETCITVGRNGVTRIEATIKSGVYSDLPYLRVWRGDDAISEFCQHNVTGVYFE